MTGLSGASYSATPAIGLAARRQTALLLCPAPLASRLSCSSLSARGSLLIRGGRRPSLQPVRALSSANSPASAPAGRQQQPGSSLDVDVKLIGVGARGVAALQKLATRRHSSCAATELWCLDVDKKVLDAAPFATTLVVPKEGSAEAAAAAAGGGGGPLPLADLQRIVGRTASDAGGRGNIGSADGGVAFVIAPGAAVPGGPALVLQLVDALRAAGHFTVAAVTQPFEFEGHAKQEQARALVAVLEERAHLVAVTEQDVLMEAFEDSQLTVAEATEIADKALEHTARCVLQAVQAQELLKSCGGALMWHGRDLRHYRRLLSPPLQQLLTCPGSGVLGRGLAALPSATAHQMGAAKALMHLASDAVMAAGESPFLDSALGSASAVLCCINLPAIGQQFARGAGDGPASALKAMQSPEGERHATRMAAQAAAGALRSITGSDCDDFVLCVEPRPLGDASGDGSTVQVEATLLVLRSPNPPSSPRPAARLLGSALSTARQALQVNAPVAEASAPSQVPPPPRQQQQVQQQRGRLSSSSWSMMSAMAGGTAAKSKPPTSQPAAASASSPPAQRQQQQRRPSPLRGAGHESSAESAAVAGARQAERVTVGDYLVESLTAQSLDLPPAAAKWRQAQRFDPASQRRLILWEVDEAEPWEEEEEESGLAALFLGGSPGRRQRQVNIRDRVAGILAQDRDDAWEADP